MNKKHLLLAIALRDHGVGSEVNPESWTQLKGSNEKGI